VVEVASFSSSLSFYNSSLSDAAFTNDEESNVMHRRQIAMETVTSVELTKMSIYTIDVKYVLNVILTFFK